MNPNPALAAFASLLVVLVVSGSATRSADRAGRSRAVFAERAADDATVSSNWAGYAITASSTGVPSQPFTDVTGTWVQPRARCTPAERSSAAFWVGLGGWDASSTALEQIGTSVDCSAGKAVYAAWYEILPAEPVALRLKVRPGDRMTGAVLVTGTRVVLSLKNLTRHTRFTKAIPSVQPLDVGSAEWIAEAPSACGVGGSCRVVPLANFGTITFTKAAAIGSAHAGTISDPSWSSAQVVLATDSTQAPGPFSNTHGALPTSLSPDGTLFSVSWRQTLTPPPIG